MKAIKWSDGTLFILDQTKLPHYQEYVECHSYKDVAKSIKEMKVRGAPVIGVSAAFGIVLGANEIRAETKDEFLHSLDEIAQILRKTRPTAVNLFWATDRMIQKARQNSDKDISDIRKILLNEAEKMAWEDICINKEIGAHGNILMDDGDTILTHCNAGALATVDYGTALGVIRAAHESRKRIHVYADETRPYLQGARLTAFELMAESIPVTLITDNMAGYFMRRKKINKVIVGADRIAANGDTANKIGTYSVAVLAKENGIPFYVAAPISTIDLSLDHGDLIPIEERSEKEVTEIGNVRIAPEGVKVANPSFDVTPNRYITAIITEKGIVYPPYRESLRKLVVEEI